MSTKVYDDDAVPTGNRPADPDKGIASLAKALRENERRRRKYAIWTYFTIIMLGITATGAIWLSQVRAQQQVEDELHQFCIQNNAQFASLKSMLSAIAIDSQTESVRVAAEDTLAKLPPPLDCSTYDRG